MAGRTRHPKQEVEEAVAYAEGKKWTFRKQGHWGRLYCPHHDRDGCQIGVFGTPRDAGNHARQIKRAVDRCPHQEEAKDENA
jgi:hypothetical protein